MIYGTIYFCLAAFLYLIGILYAAGVHNTDAYEGKEQHCRLRYLNMWYAIVFIVLKATYQMTLDIVSY